MENFVVKQTFSSPSIIIILFVLIYNTTAQSVSSNPPPVQIQLCSAALTLNRLGNEFLHIPPHLSYTKESIVFKLINNDDINHKTWCSTNHVINATIEMEETEPDPTAAPEDYEYITMTNYTSLNETEYYDYPLPPIKKYFLKDGWLRIDSDYYRHTEYCVKGINSTSKIIHVDICQPKCSPTTPCINKCCSIGSNLNIYGRNCSETGPIQWEPFMYKDIYNLISKKEMRKLQPHFIQKGPFCEKLEQWPLRRINIENMTNDITPWKILKDGSIWYMRNRRWVKLPTDNYCIDGILNYGEDVLYSGKSEDQALLVCISSEEFKATEPDMTVSYLYSILMYISAIFLLITAIVYFLLWEHQNVHGWTVLSLVITMFFMYVFVASSRIYSMSITHHEIGWLCYMFGITSHFFYLSMFAWLTLVNYDLSWTFRSLSPGSGRSKGSKRYMVYFLFAISVPVSIIIVGIILENIYGDDAWSEILTPGYGKTHCFITYWAQGVYMYYIIGFLLTCNFILIGITIITIYRFHRSTRLATRSSSSNSQTQSLELFIKLFVVMGITWIFEIISWFLSAQDTTPWYFVIFDVVNILQAIAIFIIFVCKRRTLRQLEEKYPVVQRCRNLFSKTSSANTREQPTTGSSVLNSTVGYSNSNRVRYDSNSQIIESKM